MSEKGGFGEDGFADATGESSGTLLLFLLMVIRSPGLRSLVVLYK
jgi:hypothetical protein